MGTSSDARQVYVVGTVGPGGPAQFEHAWNGYMRTWKGCSLTTYQSWPVSQRMTIYILLPSSYAIDTFTNPDQICIPLFNVCIEPRCIPITIINTNVFLLLYNPLYQTFQQLPGHCMDH